MLEYIFSGPSMTRIQYIQEPEYIALVNQIIDFHNQDTHKTGFMFNAYTEEGIGEFVYENNFTFHSTHSDSGGLQVVTLGKNVTDEIKNKIYHIQAKYADIGMCFDEIPVELLFESSKRNDNSGRFFNKNILEDKALKTAENIRNQIVQYKKMDSVCKPFIIIQGNCVETYIEWFETIKNYLSKEELNNIGGVALGFAAMGNGEKETLSAVFAFIQIRKRYLSECSFLNHLHILGVGSLNRMIPYLSLLDIEKDIYLSYDSSTHSNLFWRGSYVNNKSILSSFDKIKNKNFYNLMQNIKDYSKLLPNSVDNFVADNVTEDFLFHTITRNKNVDHINKDLYNFVVFLIFSMSVYNFKKSVDNFILLNDHHKKNISKLFLEMSLSDFNKNIDKIGLRSNKISNKKIKSFF